MKEKTTITVMILIVVAIIGGIALSACRSSESYRQKEAANYKGMAICIDETVYINTGVEMPVEPDESEMEVGNVKEFYGATDSIIKKFARIHEDDEDYLVCLIYDEWYKFIEE